MHVHKGGGPVVRGYISNLMRECGLLTAVCVPCCFQVHQHVGVDRVQAGTGENGAWCRIRVGIRMQILFG